MQQQSNNKCIWAFNACGLTLARKQDGPEHLIEETDHFLEEQQAVVSSNGTPFKDVVRKNRLLIARCKSALDRVMDDSTRRQVCPLPALSSSLSLFLTRLNEYMTLIALVEYKCNMARVHGAAETGRGQLQPALGAVGAELLLYSLPPCAWAGRWNRGCGR